MDHKIFINYRRSDSEGVTGRLYDRLESVYTRDRLFIDVDSIAKGEDFVRAMTDRVEQAQVLLAVIGPDWLTATDSEGKRRLDDSGDPVRIELEKALAAGKIIIPVLVGRAAMPREKDLPDSLKPLARRNAEEVDHVTFAQDVRRLTAEIDKAMVAENARIVAEAQRDMARLKAESEKKVRLAAEYQREQARLKAEAEARAKAEAEEKARQVAETARLEAEKLQAAEAERKRAAELALKRRAAEEARAKAEALEAELNGETESPFRAAALPASQIGRAEELARWDFVKGRGRLNELRDHLKRFPNGITADMARALLEPLEWAALAGAPDEIKLQIFLNNYPDSEHAEEAKKWLTAVQAVASHARAESSVTEAIAALASRWITAETPAGRAALIGGIALVAEKVKKSDLFAPEPLLVRLEASAWERATKAGEEECWQAFASGFPNSKYAREAIRKAESIKRKSATSAAGDSAAAGNHASEKTAELAMEKFAKPYISRRGLVLGGGAFAATAGLGTIFWDDLGLPPKPTPKPAPIAEPAKPAPKPLPIAVREIARLEGHKSAVVSVAFSPEGNRLLTGSSDSTARIWDLVTGKEVARLVGHGGKVWSAKFSPDGKLVVTGSSDRTGRIWSALTGEQIVRLEGHEDAVYSAVFSPDSRRVATGSGDKTARFWNSATGKETAQFGGHAIDVDSIAFAPDGKLFVTGSGDATARIWNAASGTEIAQMYGHSGRVWSVGFSPDGKHVVTGSADRTARIWDVATGKQIMRFDGHDNTVNSAAFSQDGARVLTSSSDDTARIWGAVTGKEILRLDGHAGSVNTAAFSPGGLRVATGSNDHSARIWEMYGL